MKCTFRYGKYDETRGQPHALKIMKYNLLKTVNNYKKTGNEVQ